MRSLSPASSKCIERFLYLPAYIMALCLIFLVDILALPFAWVTLMKRGCARGSGSSFAFGCLVFPFYGMFICVMDLALASVKLWETPRYFSKRKEIASSIAKMHKSDLQIVETILSEQSQGGKEYPLSVIVRIVREKLPFTCNYLDMAELVLGEKEPHALELIEECSSPQFKKHNSSFLKSFHHTQKKCMLGNCSSSPKSVITSRFEAVKLFLSSNSFKANDGCFYIYPHLLHCAI